MIELRRVHAHSEDPLGGQAIPHDTESVLRQRRGQGKRLPAEIASSMGEAMQADLSGVNIHADAQAAGIARSVQAKAFTHGNDVYFSGGAYAPDTQAGQRLLAHELAHVVQPESAGAAGTIGRANDPAEAAADATADRVLSNLRRQASAIRT